MIKELIKHLQEAELAGSIWGSKPGDEEVFKPANKEEVDARQGPSTLFDDFLQYCEEDNQKLADDIRTWLADYFDVKNRTIPLEPEEIEWIKANLSASSQQEILGVTIG